MKIKYICTFWGKEDIPVDKFIKMAIDAGYDGVELNVPFDEKFTSLLKKGIEDNKAIFIAQQWMPPATETVDEYRIRMRKYLSHLATLNPIFINAHTGKDFFSFEDNCSAIEDCNQITESTGVKIIHETHRGRFSHHAYSLLPYIDKYKDLHFNADFSHFCNVSESLLEDQEHILDKIIPRCHYIHSRVGFDQSAQVNHPFAPEWKDTMDRFVSWWQKIIDAAKKRNEDTFYICPEFGPYPYMPEIPFTKQPVADQWKINIQMMEYLKNTLV